MNDDILIHTLGSIDGRLRDLQQGQNEIRRDLAVEQVATTKIVTRVATKVSALVGAGTLSITGLFAWIFG